MAGGDAEMDATVLRMLGIYEGLIRRFVSDDMSADDFETSYLARFKSDPDQIVGKDFDLLDELFADVDAYVADPVLRVQAGGIDGEDLRTRASSVYGRLFGEHQR